MPISRLYTTPTDAQAAADDLIQSGFRPEDIDIVVAGAGYVGAEALLNKGVLKVRAKSYAEAVRHGAALLLVGAPLGTVAEATEILEKIRPGDAGPAQAIYEGLEWEEGAPFSGALGVPVLSHGAAPFSSFFGLGTLSKSTGPMTSSFGLPLLSKGASPFSSMLGLKLLAGSAAPLSSLFKLPVLTKAKSAR